MFFLGKALNILLTILSKFLCYIVWVITNKCPVPLSNRFNIKDYYSMVCFYYKYYLNNTKLHIERKNWYIHVELNNIQRQVSTLFFFWRGGLWCFGGVFLFNLKVSKKCRCHIYWKNAVNTFQWPFKGLIYNQPFEHWIVMNTSSVKWVWRWKHFLGELKVSACMGGLRNLFFILFVLLRFFFFFQILLIVIFRFLESTTHRPRFCVKGPCILFGYLL